MTPPSADAAETISTETSDNVTELASPQLLMRQLLEQQQRGFATDRIPSAKTRRDRLDRLDAALANWWDRLTEAATADFGHRDPFETELSELVITKRALRHAKSVLGRWMKPKRRWLPVTLLPAKAHVQRVPLGVVGVIAPWNYPIQLALIPLIDALAAGNRVMLKPSELTPKTADALKGLLEEAFAEDEVAVVTGDAEIGATFSSLPFDHLLFTGSTAVGRKVAEAAAKNLTPVTLELGGKSPVVVEPGYPVADLAAHIGWGKGFNGGQTCIAPDYVLAPAAMHQPMADALIDRWSAMFGAEGAEMTRVISDRHFARLTGLWKDAEAKGATIVKLAPCDPETRMMPPIVVLGATPDMAVMQEEIFGPILPIVTAECISDAADWIETNAPTPLTLYAFAKSANSVDQLRVRLAAGSVAVNGTLLHFGCENLPIGGVGASGIGEYHGREGFDRLTRPQPVFRLGRPHALTIVGPPYGRLAGLLKWMMGGRS